MAWRDARAELRSILEGLGTITVPVPDDDDLHVTIERVYEMPPESIADAGEYPCVVMLPPARDVERSASTSREKIYRQRIVVRETGADLDVAAATVDAIVEAIDDALDSAVKLNDNADYVTGPSWEEAFGDRDGARDVVAMSGTLVVMIETLKTFAS